MGVKFMMCQSLTNMHNKVHASSLAFLAEG